MQQKTTQKKITQETAERARPGADSETGEPKDAILWDSGLKGFGLICRKNGETYRRIYGPGVRPSVSSSPNGTVLRWASGNTGTIRDSRQIRQI